VSFFAIPDAVRLDNPKVMLWRELRQHGDEALLKSNKRARFGTQVERPRREERRTSIARKIDVLDILRAVPKHGGLAGRTVVFVLLALCFGSAAPFPSYAQVQLPSVNLGETNFEDAFGAPGWLLQEFPEAYIATELKDSQGRTVPGNNRVTTYSTTTHVAFVSKRRVLGGWLSGEVLQPLVDLEVQLASGSSSRVRGLADMTVGAGWRRLSNDQSG